MQFAFSRALLICACLALAAAAKQPPQQQQKQVQPNATPAKPKRDAGLSFGSGIYHGPSHKYLPPAASAGYDSTYATLHGNGLASSSGFDFASLDTDNSQQQQQQQYHHHHHYSHQPHTYQSLASHHGHGRPVYISSSSAGGGSAAGGGYHHRQQAPKVETYIVQTSSGHGHGPGPGNGHQGHGFGGGYKYAGHGGGYLSLLGGAHKQHGGGAGGGGGSTYLLATPSYSSSSSSHGSGAGFSLGQHASLGSSHGLGHGLNLGAQHYASGLGHGLEQQEHTGFSFEGGPSIHYKQQPLSSYGVPLLAGYEHSTGQHEVAQEELHQQHKTQTDQQTPAYALGHKGLGHFSYTSSKPLALNTDIHHGGAPDEHNELFAELSKSPFKPSAFLGAKHESSVGFDFATPSAQSTGYDYAAPALLYGAPGQSGDSATPIFEPESTYLPPVSSYGAPATPTHSYH
ncbi:hornerin [Drosophila montana]|uniref:hornerin n=1 Tax=Drosophila montana TaxID=40370 RepID=UPI00313E157F